MEHPWIPWGWLANYQGVWAEPNTVVLTLLLTVGKFSRLSKGFQWGTCIRNENSPLFIELSKMIDCNHDDGSYYHYDSF